MLSIVNNEKLGLTQEIKNQNKNSISKVCECFKNIREKLKDELMDKLTIGRLENDYRDLVKEIYDKKSEKFKSEMTYQKFCVRIKDLIYDNIANNRKEIINNVINHGFVYFNLEIIKKGINEQFKYIEEKILSEIYTEIFKELNKN